MQKYKMAKEMDKINYGNFPTVRKVVMSCDFTTPEDKEKAFQLLVRCLINKHVYRFDGKLVRDRAKCLEYLIEVCSRLEDSELDLILINSDEFYEKFIFAPNKGARSLFSEFKKPALKHKFRVPMNEIFEDYRQETGYSPYEKISEDVLDVFLSECEALYA